jgi:hypothetical protein
MIRETVLRHVPQPMQLKVEEILAHILYRAGRVSQAKET